MLGLGLGRGLGLDGFGLVLDGGMLLHHCFRNVLFLSLMLVLMGLGLLWLGLDDLRVVVRYA